jgi:hypothetical protein
MTSSLKGYSSIRIKNGDRLFHAYQITVSVEDCQLSEILVKRLAAI